MTTKTNATETNWAAKLLAPHGVTFLRTEGGEYTGDECVIETSWGGWRAVYDFADGSYRIDRMSAEAAEQRVRDLVSNGWEVQ